MTIAVDCDVEKQTFIKCNVRTVAGLKQNAHRLTNISDIHVSQIYSFYACRSMKCTVP